MTQLHFTEGDVFWGSTACLLDVDDSDLVRDLATTDMKSNHVDLLFAV
jgi:hypothetical protein